MDVLGLEGSAGGGAMSGSWLAAASLLSSMIKRRLGGDLTGDSSSTFLLFPAPASSCSSSSGDSSLFDPWRPRPRPPMGKARLRATGFRGGLGASLLSGVMGINVPEAVFAIGFVAAFSSSSASPSSSDSRDSPYL